MAADNKRQLPAEDGLWGSSVFLLGTLAALGFIIWSGKTFSRELVIIASAAGVLAAGADYLYIKTGTKWWNDRVLRLILVVGPIGAIFYSGEVYEHDYWPVVKAFLVTYTVYYFLLFVYNGFSFFFVKCIERNPQ